MKHSCYIIIYLDVYGPYYTLLYSFGTNLLTGGPAHIVVLLPVLVFRRKGISNGVQKEWNLRKSYFWNRTNPRNLECKPGDHRGGHETGGAPYPLVASSAASWLALQVLWITFVPKITLPKVSFRLDSVWYSFSSKYWNRQKTAIRAGPPVSRLVPKMI